MADIGMVIGEPMPDERCEPPEGTPEGTVCVLERRRGETTSVITPMWMGDGWNVATGGDIIVGPAVLGARGWRFVRVAGDVRELSMIERPARAAGSTDLLVPGTLRGLLRSTAYGNDDHVELLLQDVVRAILVGWRPRARRRGWRFVKVVGGKDA